MVSWRVLVASILIVASAAITATKALEMQPADCIILKAVRWTGVEVNAAGACQCPLDDGASEVPIACDKSGFVTLLEFIGAGIKGSLPASFSGLSKLSQLHLNDNDFTGTLPKAWGGLTSLEELELSGNSIKGTLPPVWGNMKALTWLDLGHNKITGTLPSAWNGMAKIETLYLSDNEITGGLPQAWSDMPASLSVVFLMNNNIQGALPQEWASLTSLVLLYLDNNKLAGSLPYSWNEMTKLSTLSLGGNKLGGALPPEWGSFDNLSQLTLVNNKHVTGAIPAEWINQRASFKLMMNVTGTDLCGPVLPASSHVIVSSDHPLPKCASTCRKAPLVRIYTFTVRSTSDFSTVRNALRAALQKVYRHYNTPYPSATVLGGPPGQGGVPSGGKRVTWRFRATVAIGAKNQCKPRGDAMHADLRQALAISGSSIKA